MKPPSEAATPSSSAEQLVEQLLVELLLVPPSQRAAAARALCAQHPQHAALLSRRLELLESELPESDEHESSFGRFELLRRLGGGMTDVYLARDPDRPQEVVLKVLRHAALHDRTVRTSLAQEAMAAAQLRHPSIGAVLEAGEVDGTPYLVLPYVAGLTLSEWIEGQTARRRRVGVEELELLLAWFADIARALHAAHAVGLVHRDVKPSNILIPWQGPPKLLDFGLCQQVRADAATPHAAAGTLPYMAPEILADRDLPLGPAADIYALGITLFEAIALRLPFAAETHEGMVAAILRGRFQWPRHSSERLPRDLWRVVATATAREPWDRYGSAQALAEDLARLRRGERVLGGRHRRRQRAWRWLATHRVVATLSAAAFAALLWTGLAVTDVLAAGHAAAAELELLEVPAHVRNAQAHAAALVPGWPQQIPELQRWLAHEGEPLAALLPPLRARVARLAAERRPAAEAEATTLRVALAELTPFAEGEWSTLAVLRRRRQWAERVQAETIDAHAAEWAAVRAQIRADPRYHGLDLPPQLDLVPLGRDPGSGLFEFYHPRSGAGPVPRERNANGCLIRGEGTGLIFVLVPGNRFLMGEQGDHSVAPHYRKDAGPYARPNHVTLDAFFVSKFEMTQGQWLRLTGEQPSFWRIGSWDGGAGLVTPLYPVENVTALECDRVLGEVGLLLPTEAQWEYAARAGAEEHYHFGTAPDEICRYANVFDRQLAAKSPGAAQFFDCDDGYANTAPVGCKLPNDFGLHDTLGNVAEWCRDDFVSYANNPARDGDGQRLPPRLDRRRILRGGHCGSDQVGSANRSDDVPDRRYNSFGVRPVRPVLRQGGT